MNIESKLHPAEFKKFCRKELSGDMNALEKERMKYIAGSVICAVISIIMFIISGILYYNNNFSYEFETYIGITFPLGSLFIMGSCASVKLYKTKAKKLILQKLLSYIGDFKISANKINRSYVESLKLFDYFNRYSCDDSITGSYGLLNLDISELHLKKVVRTKKHTHTVTIFQGILVCFKSLKKYSGYTVVKNNGISLFAGKEKVNLEDPEFEQYYDVYSSDQVEARYLLTSSFMNRMVQLAKKNRAGNITISFEHGNVNLAIESSKDWFEIPILKPATRIENYRAIVFELINILKIIDSLKMEQNIGL